MIGHQDATRFAAKGRRLRTRRRELENRDRKRKDRKLESGKCDLEGKARGLHEPDKEKKWWEGRVMVW